MKGLRFCAVPLERQVMPLLLEKRMKIDLIGMIINTSKRGAFNGIVLDDQGDEMDEVKSLDTLIMEYAKVRNGGQSDIVVVTKRLTPN